MLKQLAVDVRYAEILALEGLLLARKQSKLRHVDVSRSEP